ncbi:MAG TPA: hypothetical protein VKB31_08575 [Trueperaceae bacterium]|nr:hypothetical protein [Trueperaceae bacterium]
MNRSQPHGAARRRCPAASSAPRALVLALAVALVGCGSPDASGTALAAPGTAPEDISLERALDATLRPSGPGAAQAFLASLPPPRAVHERSVSNPQDPGRKDTLRTLVFRGIAVTVYRVSASGKRFPVAVKVTGKRFRAPDGLRVGLAASQVRAVLGAPSARSPSLWRYRRTQPRDGAPFELRVHFQGGRVSALAWVAYRD